MPRGKTSYPPGSRFGPLSIEQLEVGLRMKGHGNIDQNCFWDENIETFRQTVLFAIRETSDALLSATIPLRWRLKLESELEALVQYIELADRYIERRAVSRGFEPRPPLPQLH